MSIARAYWPLAFLIVAFTIALSVMSPGLFTIDEFIYFAGADAMARSGSFIVQNGTAELASDHLRLALLVEGPAGLTPQYPPGMAAVGGPLLALFGIHGLMLINAIGAALTVFVLYRIASRHFGGQKEALVACALLIGGTFFLEYAFAVWPHAVSVLCVTLAMSLTLDALDSENGSGVRWLSAGAAIGVGMLFRTDTILALPALGLAAFLFTNRPILGSSMIGLGFMPFLAAASATNWIKFGTLNPLSYGRKTSSAVTFADHLPALIGLAIVGLAIVALRLNWPRIRNRRLVAWSAAALALVAAIAAYSFTLRYLHGFWGLVVDATILQDSRAGVVYLENGTVAFWGLWKKALGQSMPWLGLLIASCWTPAAVDRRVKLSILFLAAAWSLPFFPKDWHGGMGSNMRYFLPLLPFFCALAASVLVQFFERTENGVRMLVIGAVLGVISVQLWLTFATTDFAGVNQKLSTYVFGATAFLSTLWALLKRHRPKLEPAVVVAVGCGLTLSIHLTIFDFYNGQANREKSLSMSAAYASLPDRALAYAPSRYLLGWALEPGHVAALPDAGRTEFGSTGATFDYALIEQALGSDFRVFVYRGYVTDELRQYAGSRLIQTEIGPEDNRLLEILPPADPSAP